VVIASGVKGNPALIQGRFGTRGNFELVVPLVSGGIGHYWRDNDAPGLPWSTQTVFGATAGQINGVALIESTFGTPGNLEVIATAGSGVSRSLVHFWRDDSGWHGPNTVPLPANFSSTGPDGIPGFVQTADGDFHVVFGGTGTLKQMKRDNAAPGQPWVPIVAFAGFPATIQGAVSLLQSNFGPPGAGNLEALGRKADPGPGVTHVNHYWRQIDPAASWNGPGPDLLS
jgi:hypothetical protein